MGLNFFSTGGLAVKTVWRLSIAWPLLVAFGCGQGATDPAANAGDSDGRQVAVVSPDTGHDHGGWWCDEHGVPEAKCSRCSSKAAAEFQKKGDWCQEHDRARSQCFICDPKAKERYAALYRAREGKEPPPLTEEDENEVSPKESDG
jgi:hypothetical protein